MRLYIIIDVDSVRNQKERDKEIQDTIIRVTSETNHQMAANRFFFLKVQLKSIKIEVLISFAQGVNHNM